MNTEYYRECLRKYADSSEEDAIRIEYGAIEMDIIDSMCIDANDKVAHQASIILGLNSFKHDKDAYMKEVCYHVCTDGCDINKVIARCREISKVGESYDFEEDISMLCRLLTLTSRSGDLNPLGYVSDEIQRAYLVHDKPEYSQLDSNIDYILYDLLDVLDLRTKESIEYVSKHRENFIRPIMNLTVNSGDVMLMGQMKQIYENWMEWR